ncbi:dihydroorotase [Oceanibaculum sp.]|uniref:dihydroorotase n=1 Tax=Oceanibaculum sp. TaxID=1903597 RepID=UPI0025865402|nr:dihydroorotase [Oceanibaculum sp.]MCH2396028.1 dihydroorotase [Oceanibaculum sp.]
MTDSLDLAVTGGTVVTPNGRERIDIGIRGGRIVALGNLGGAKAAQVFDATGLTVLPGVIDTQVHFREPGNEHKEDLESGTRGAVLGGVTAIFEMPNTKPSTTDEDALADKLNRARGRAWCDHAFFMGAAPENIGNLASLERLPGCCGVKVFMGSSTGSLLVEDDATLEALLADGVRRVAVHAEDEMRLRERAHVAKEAGHPRAHPDWRDVETALNATKRVCALARKTGRRVHVLHITTAEEMEFLATQKDYVTVETTPQHLTLEAPDCYDRLGTFAQMNPPIRDARHRAGLWRGITAGVVDVLGSDHAPHTREEKAKPYPDSPSGMPGVQTMLPLMLNHVNEGNLTLERLVDLLCSGPQRLFGIAGKGRIALGYDGDLTLVDLQAKKTITHAMMANKSGWTPFDGMEVTGWPMATIIRGNIVMRDGEVQDKPLGQPVRFTETLNG